MKRFLLVSSLCALCGLTDPARAVTVFSDNFNADTPALNKTTFLGGWTVSNGTVDLVDFSVGRLIDLDGSSGDAGVFSKTLTLDAGVPYSATFGLAGSQRGSAVETVVASFGTTTQTFTVAAAEAFSTRTLTFTPTTTDSYSLTFANSGGDNVGALLDNVSIDSNAVAAIPEPETYALMLVGLAAVTAMQRRRKGSRA